MRLTCTAFAILVTVCTWTGRTFFPDLMSADEPNVSSEPGSFSALVSSCGIETIGFENGPISGLDVQDSEVFAVNPCDVPGDFLEQKFEGETHCTGVDDFPAQSAAKTSVDAVVSRAEYNRILFEARMNSASDLEMKMPWEKGIMKQIFDSDDDSIFLQPYQQCHHIIFSLHLHLVVLQKGLEAHRTEPQSRAWCGRIWHYRFTHLLSRFCQTEICLWKKRYCGTRQLKLGCRFSRSSVFPEC